MIALPAVQSFTLTIKIKIAFLYFRLVSAFKNKLNPGKPWYHGVYGKRIIAKYRPNATSESLKNGHDVSFPEFIHFIVGSQGNCNFCDEHWMPQYYLSLPCLVPYKFIGKFETFNQDMEYLLRKLYGVRKPNELGIFNEVGQTAGDGISSLYRGVPRSHIERLRSMYKFDFLFFNYSLDLARPRV